MDDFSQGSIARTPRRATQVGPLVTKRQGIRNVTSGAMACPVVTHVGPIRSLRSLVQPSIPNRSTITFGDSSTLDGEPTADALDNLTDRTHSGWPATARTTEHQGLPIREWSGPRVHADVRVAPSADRLVGQ